MRVRDTVHRMHSTKWILVGLGLLSRAWRHTKELWGLRKAKMGCQSG